MVANLWVFRVDSCKPFLSVVEGFVANLSPRPCEILKNQSLYIGSGSYRSGEYDAQKTTHY